MSVTVEFIGGPYGGRIQAFPKYPGPRISMPAYVHRPVTAMPESGTVPLPMSRYTPETYVIDGGGYGDKPLRYRWQRPDIEGMQAEIGRLKRALEDARKPTPRKGLMRFGR